MMYGTYKNSRNLSWNILIKEKIIKLPVNIILSGTTMIILL